MQKEEVEFIGPGRPRKYKFLYTMEIGHIEHVKCKPKERDRMVANIRCACSLSFKRFGKRFITRADQTGIYIKRIE